MARYQVILSYDGTEFAGSQRQAKKRTVQGDLEKALRQIKWTGRSVILAGRTDTGVHAAGQVASFDLDWQHTDGDLLRALNANLPGDMAAQVVQVASPKFHPRYDATSRRYRYRLFCQPVRNPLRERYAWRVWPAVDGAAIQAVAPLFIGQHDFAAYGTPPRAECSSVRTVMSASWQQQEDEWHFEVQANAFLYRMVRRLVFIQVVVGQGKLSAKAVAGSLAGQAEGFARSALPAGLAPAHGLSLVEVTY